MTIYIAGIDEAGRGPVIGPMVMVIAAMPKDTLDILTQLNVKDSKLLSEKQREAILIALEKHVLYEKIELTPDIIDSAVFSEETNLNWLEAATAADLISRLQKRIPLDTVIVDCPSPNIAAYTHYITKHLTTVPKMIVEHKADFNHKIVGAASIIAKVGREKKLEALRKQYGVDFGSGYPADPKTKTFLQKHYADKKLAPLFRKSWGTYKNLTKKQSSLGDY